jgi:Kef-type K+ transport system membrane component KefB
MSGAVWTTILAIAYTACVVLLSRWIVRKKRGFSSSLSSQSLAAWVFLALLISALTAEMIGIHAIFGAFLIGAVIPHDSRVAQQFRDKLHDFVTILLLPAFFAVTGMRTEIGLLNTWSEWLMCGWIIAVATLGKFGGTYVAAKLCGLDKWTAASLGALMNTRGLMELVVLNVGLDLGIISPTLFTMMVIMALVTTFATTPTLAWIEWLRTRKLG